MKVLFALFSLCAATNFDELARMSLVKLDVPSGAVDKLLTRFPDLDVWPDGPLVAGINKVRLQPDKGHTLREIALVAPDVRLVEILAPNLRDSALANELRYKKWVADGSRTDEWFETYHNLEELVGWYRSLAAAHPNYITYHPAVGRSIQNRSLDVMVLHFGDQNPGAGPRPRVWVQALVHAREWIAGATTQYVVDALVKYQSAPNSEGGGLLNDIDLYVVPVLNPDGYLYSWERDRMWRKNRRLVTGNTYGVDCNRNYDDHWGGDGSSGVPSSETYRGTAPFSEPETTFVKNAMTQFAPGGGWACSIDMHSYSQLILRPWGWTANPALMDTPTEAELDRIGADIKAAMEAETGCSPTNATCRWINQHAGDLYAAAGGASDWFYSGSPRQGGVAPIDYTFEGRPNSNSPYGFQLPANQIIGAGEEMYANYQVLLAECAQKPAPLRR